MIIRRSKGQYALYRYGGVSDGKNIEVRIGNVPFGTKPESVPDEIVQDLTPRELGELKDVLAKDERELLELKVASVEVDLKVIDEAVKTGALDGQTATKLGLAAKALLKTLSKSKPLGDSVERTTATKSTVISAS
ncbi:MAG: hypothetical protein KBC73_18640 [Burkholderiaceae bacterium]|nr:hypothetical protein [Burkholderiaceae bacterium]